MIVDTAPLQAAKSAGPPTAASGITGDPAVGNGAKGEVLGSSTARGAAAPIADDSTGAVSVVRGDLSCSDVAAAIKSFAGGDDGGGDHAETTSSSTLSVFHLASVMSGQGEEDFGEALRVNIDGVCSVPHANTYSGVDAVGRRTKVFVRDSTLLVYLRTLICEYSCRVVFLQ